MNITGDQRNIFQEVVAPDMNEVNVRLDAIERRLERLERQLDGSESCAKKRFHDAATRINQGIRLKALEARVEQLEKLAGEQFRA